MNLIREKKIPHCSPTFMVRKHSEIKRGKTRMVINHKQVFQRKMDKIFSDYSSFIIVYIYDMLICSDNEKCHEKHLNIFITLCKEHDIILSKKKVEIKKKEI